MHNNNNYPNKKLINKHQIKNIKINNKLQNKINNMYLNKLWMIVMIMIK